MADNKALKGLDTVMKNLNKEIQKIANQTPAGLITASIIIQRATEKESPKTPVDTSNLRSSFFRVITGIQTDNKGKFRGENAGTLAADYASAISELKADVDARRFPTLMVGFSANYAIWAHENMEAKFKRPGAGPKFLEEAVNNNKGLILNAIRDNVKIK